MIEKLINWSELSRILTGKRQQITSKYDGKLYKRVINDLKAAIKAVLVKHDLI